MPDRLQRISPCLWFDHQAEEAANFYISLVANSKIESIQRSPAERRRADRAARG